MSLLLLPILDFNFFSEIKEGLGNLGCGNTIVRLFLTKKGNRTLTKHNASLVAANGHCVDRNWASTGAIPSRNWASTGAIPSRNWVSSDTTLCRN